MKVDYESMTLDFVLDGWQKEVLEADGNLCICSGRQVGKSQIIAIKTGEFIANNPKKKVLIISITEDQAQNMLQKILLYLHDNYPTKIAKGKDKPTKHKIHMKNGAEAVTKAVGQYGLGVLGMTVDVVVPDECAYLPEAIWQSITPMLLTTGGVMWLLSTPNLQEGYFYDAYTSDMGFQTFHVNSEDVADKRPEPQRTYMREHLKREKERMTDLEYAQQYLAQFLEEVRQLFPNELIEKLCTRKPGSPQNHREYYLGVDIARMGKDESTFEIIKRENDQLFHIENLTTTKTYTTDTTKKIIELDRKYNFRTIYIDDGGLGAAVFDQLLESPETRRKVIPINNASRALDRDEKYRKKLLKENLYINLLRLMEANRITLLDDELVRTSLKSVMAESTKTGELRIYGRYTHIVEGLIRAAWCVQDRRLNPIIM